MTIADVTLDQVLALARRLRPVDQARLIAQLAPSIEHVLTPARTGGNAVRSSLRGLLHDLGSAPSDDDISAVQHEMWATFANEAS